MTFQCDWLRRLRAFQCEKKKHRRTDLHIKCTRAYAMCICNVCLLVSLVGLRMHVPLFVCVCVRVFARVSLAGVWSAGVCVSVIVSVSMPAVGVP